ncbi:hypothetical protein CI109_100222 [Kwoniella shandongensis]|uniref:Uncharacterized protein n=1 Tax=Kwoniella shandongensis TaxID=1734106 RepID=A0A5M6BWQ5_9TREE|nr:uncharacterized protein CI109_006243 [Kwoniella shandongensis]KAA5525439.1 hypothetical protein CI109_006243 [Kwoniella shandongensis]
MTRHNLFHFSRHIHSSTPPDVPTTNDYDDHAASSQDVSRVRTRLHALFTPESSGHTSASEGGPGPSSSRHLQLPHEDGVGEDGEAVLEGGEEVARSKTYPLFVGHHLGPNVVEPPKKPQREAIKVLVVTWNMGDALPKGDLSVLLGQVPPYQAPPPTDGVPQLSIENAHPYHIVVVAGQECPTPSGAPRGLGGGLIKGVTLRHKRELKEKEKQKEKEREKDQSDGAVEKDHDETRLGLKSPDVVGEAEYEDGELAKTGRTPSPMSPHSPFLHRHPQNSKGWSQMLDDYFCGPSPNNRFEGITSSLNSLSITSRDSPIFPKHPSHNFPSTQQPSLLRSASAPITPTNPIAIHKPVLGPSHLNLSPSPLARSSSSFDSNATSTSSSESGVGQDGANEDGVGTEEGVNGHDNDNEGPNLAASGRPKAESQPVKAKVERPEIVIPVDEAERTKGGNGSYVHVAKERLLGMYLSIYVYKGCEHLIQGIDKDFVTAGLAGGRVGNKGGIGVSLKLADHRFLFVNSHLAAHTGRQAARLANIAKIKSELRLDCFLPKDDPRAGAEDITERFDTTFWCGDLNFRLELSRLHADWLIEQKKYAELLMWDQLKLAMKDPKTNPFPGFEEGPIDFPCTFKYDVWKSVRTTNRELRRTMKRRKSSASAVAVDLSTSATVQQSLSHVPEGNDDSEELENDPNDESCLGNLPPTGSDDDSNGEDASMSRRSFESSRYTSTVGTDIGQEELDEITRENMNQRSHRAALETVIKEKTRHFLGLVKMDGILTPSSSHRGVRRRASVKRKTSVKRNRYPEEFDSQSRRTSMSSFVSDRNDQDDEDEAEPRPPRSSEANSRRILTSLERKYDSSGGTNASDDVILAAPVGQTDSVLTGTSPKNERQGLARRLTLLKRTASTKSVRDGGEEELEEGETRLEEDHREGVYDTSKKQRVPSWCDRVLWKAHVEPDPEPDDLDDHLTHHPSLDREKPFHRLSTAFANFGGHFKLPMGRTSSIEPSTADRTAVRFRQVDDNPSPRKGHPESPSGGEKQTADIYETLVASPSQSPGLDGGQQPPGGMIPSPRKASESPSRGRFGQPRYPITGSTYGTPPKLTTRSFSGSALGGGILSYSSSAQDKRGGGITFDNAALPAEERLKVTLAANTGSPRPRSNSDVLASTPKPEQGEFAGDGIRARRGKTIDSLAIATTGLGSAGADITSPASGSASASLRMNQSNLLSRRTRTLSSQYSPLSSHFLHPTSAHQGTSRLDALHPQSPIGQAHVLNASSLPLAAANGHGHGHGPLPMRDNDRNAFRRFLRDLPGWLHRSSTVAGERTSGIGNDHQGGGEEKRWRKGEVRCLHYGTIDDVGMRLLEGRSDHRPAIFAGAVYI